VKAVIDDTMSDPRNAVSWMNGASPAEAFATLLQRARQKALATSRLKEIEGLENDAKVGTNVHGTDLGKSLRMQFGSALKSDAFLRRLAANPDLVSQMQDVFAGSFPQGISQRLGGGDLSKWRLHELAALAFPATLPAIATARALGYMLSKVADARTQNKVNTLKQVIAKQGALPVTTPRSTLPARALIGALGTNCPQGQ
jgi:hypothetical protein